MLAGLFHDTGKFLEGKYHAEAVPEEELAVQVLQLILKGTAVECKVHDVANGILSLYKDDDIADIIGQILYDADRLDKLGCMGVAAFFSKNAL